jgi:hypothetical protein
VIVTLMRVYERAIETEDCMIMSRLKRATMMGLSIRMTAGDDQ